MLTGIRIGPVQIGIGGYTHTSAHSHCSYTETSLSPQGPIHRYSPNYPFPLQTRMYLSLDTPFFPVTVTSRMYPYRGCRHVHKFKGGKCTADGKEQQQSLTFSIVNPVGDIYLWEKLYKL